MTPDTPPTSGEARSDPAQIPPPSAEAVRLELARILGSTDFQGSERLSRFLSFVVEEALQGRSERLKAYFIAVTLLKRPEDFDPDTDTIVRNQGSRVRRALEHYYLTAGARSPIRICLPSGCYRPLFSRADAAPEPKPDSSDRESAPHEPVVAIRPFADLTPDRSLSWFAEEFSQELVVALTPFEDFRLIPPQIDPTVLSTHTGTEALAQPRPARFQLTGSVARSGTTVKITAVLHEAGSGEAFWSQSLLRQLTGNNEFDVQREVSRNIAALIADLYGVIPRYMSRRSMGAGTDDLSFYEGIFRYLNTPIRSREQYLEMRAALERAVTQEPNHAFAHAILANACIHDFNYMFNTMEKPLDRALALARRAVALDSSSQHAETFLAYAYAQRREISQFFAHAEHCMKLNPDSCFCSGLMGLCMGVAGDWEAALFHVHAAMDLLPSYPRILHHVPFMDHFRRGEFRAALAEARLYNVPGFFWAPLLRAAALGSLGQLEDGGAAIAELVSLRPDFVRNGRELVRRLVPHDAIVERLMDGLHRAGLPEADAPQ
jgi:adenylate cyclase